MPGRRLVSRVTQEGKGNAEEDEEVTNTDDESCVGEATSGKARVMIGVVSHLVGRHGNAAAATRKVQGG